ncbi:unnamed protein product [Ceutorhynchus assimilis]|uniref:phospholipase A2 n=1 Tax=Ceutorhynchus assimilis TaxID=467358 RepID=A0A9N9MK47_9CUCU|nr:unnamed protein product [Ceutorhynchus assimilis]
MAKLLPLLFLVPCMLTISLAYQPLYIDDDSTFRNPDGDSLETTLTSVVFGTNWCGPGNTAQYYDDLGKLEDLDACCRAHDNCPNKISVGEKKYGLQNTMLKTGLSCHCEHAFLQCLRNVNSEESRSVRKFYFELLPANKCFQKEVPYTCIDSGPNKCGKMIFDLSKPEKYQWFDVDVWEHYLSWKLKKGE